MSSLQMLQEHWTDEGSAVVVMADTATMNQLLSELDLPQENTVSISEDRLALAFWGEELKSYVAWRDGSGICSNGSVARASA